MMMTTNHWQPGYFRQARRRAREVVRFRAVALVLTGVMAILGFVGCRPAVESSPYQTYDQLLTGEGDQPAAMDSAATASVEAPRETAEGLTAPDPSLVEDIPASALAPLNIVDGSSASGILKVVTPSPALVPGEPTPATSASADARIKLLVPEKEFRKEGPGEAARVSYDDLDLLKILNMEPVPADADRYFPDWLKALDGKSIRIRGFMYPTFESSGIEQFVLARDNQICCFGRDPKVYDLIAVTMAPGVQTDYIPNRPFDVVGTFRIELLAEGGKPMGLYWLEGARILR